MRWALIAVVAFAVLGTVATAALLVMYPDPIIAVFLAFDVLCTGYIIGLWLSDMDL